MATTTSFLSSNPFSVQKWSSQRGDYRRSRPLAIKSQQQQKELELKEPPSKEGSLPQQQQQQQEVLGQASAPPKVQSQPRQPMARSKNMSLEYGGQFLSCTTRHVRIYAAYIDPETHAFDQTQMDKLTLLLDPTDEFVWTPDTCQKVYAYFQELVDHYEGAPLSEYTLRLIGSDIEHFIRKMLYDGEIKYNLNARVLNFSMGKPRVKFNSSEFQNV
uniref:NAD(P)H-quinone oxidoreductase subunit M, chloroplastic n=1 Tax=Cypripedium formosanum TaxID=53042 RepID=A0A0F7CYX0_9ASPA